MKKVDDDLNLTPHQVSKGMIPWWRTWRKERWPNFFFSTKKTESHLDIKKVADIQNTCPCNKQESSHVKNLGGKCLENSGVENPGIEIKIMATKLTCQESWRHRKPRPS